MGKIITVDFRNDTLFATERDDGVFVALKPICDALGLNWPAQFSRLREDPILSEGIATVAMPSVGGAQETTCLRLDLVNGWLFKIDSRRVRDEETRQKVLTYQRECYAVLFRHFYGRAERAAEPELDDTAESESARLRAVTEARHTFGTHAAAQLWFRLKLPIVPAMRLPPTQSDLFPPEEAKPLEPAA